MRLDPWHLGDLVATERWQCLASSGRHRARLIWTHHAATFDHAYCLPRVNSSHCSSTRPCRGPRDVCCFEQLYQPLHGPLWPHSEVNDRSKDTVGNNTVSRASNYIFYFPTHRPSFFQRVQFWWTKLLHSSKIRVWILSTSLDPYTSCSTQQVCSNASRCNLCWHRIR